MSYATGFFISWGVLASAVCAAAQDPRPGQLNARELFYNTATGHEAPAATPAPKPAVQHKAKPRAVAKAASASPPAPAAAPAGQATVPMPTGKASVIPVSAVVEPEPNSTPAPALGLKYTVVKLVDRQRVEVPPDTVFHANDRVQFSVEPNGPGYLYIVKQGTSGMWEPVFPSAKISGASNRVEGWRKYMMPPGYALIFDEQTGTEKIFIVLSRVEVPDLENLIYELKGGAHPVSTPEAAPNPLPKMLVAGLRIGDDTIGRLREAYARDLIIQKVDDDTPGDRKENAVYVVNPTGSSESRVTADIKLVHQ
jgi:hypothetical protein